MKTLHVVSTSLNAALYAAFGYLTYLGIFTPVIGVVRFWPSVVIPAVFAVLFGPLVGGLGAAIGIFISDMMIHGNALLSLTVGVPANFVGFYLVGLISRRMIRTRFVIVGSLLGSIAAIFSIWLFLSGYLDFVTSILFSTTCLFSVILALVFCFKLPCWRSYGIASILGLGVGSGIIGAGVWAFSQFFLLPNGEFQLPLYSSIIWFIWTFCTEIPFQISLGPLILKACYLAFPGLKPEIKK